MFNYNYIILTQLRAVLDWLIFLNKKDKKTCLVEEKKDRNINKSIYKIVFNEFLSFQNKKYL
jgi:hypothetical protein